MIMAAAMVALLSGLAQATPVTQAIPRLMDLGDIPGLSLAVLHGDQAPEYATFGVIDQRSGKAVQDDTVFEAASLSKTLFAYVTLRLADRGLIDLDTPLVDYAAYPRLAGDKRHRLVTARMCLSHTTGLPNWGTRFIAHPGTQFTYSGEGIRFLRKTLEAVTGQSLEALAVSEAFEPLGMHDSSYLWQARFRGNRAVGHDNRGRPQARRQCPDGSAAASLHTTAHDYARFLQACLSGEGLSPAMHQAMLTAATPAAMGQSREANSHLGWSLGWGTMDTGHGNLIWQWGDNGDTVALAVGDPTSGEGLVYLANSATGLSVAHALMADVISDRAWFLEALGYQRYDSPQRVRWYENQARQALSSHHWARAGQVLETILDLRPDHPWAGVQLEQIQVRQAHQRQGGPRRDHG